MIDFLDTRIGEVLRKAKLLSDAMAWMDLFTTGLKTEIIRDWIQKDQLTGRGIDADGTNIGHYSFMTEWISKGRKQEGDHYTLDDTGEFYRSMWITVLRDEIVIDGDSSRMEDQDWWRDEILGLSDENIEKLIQKAREHYPNYVRKVLGLDR